MVQVPEYPICISAVHCEGCAALQQNDALLTPPQPRFQALHDSAARRAMQGMS